MKSFVICILLLFIQLLGNAQTIDQNKLKNKFSKTKDKIKVDKTTIDQTKQSNVNMEKTEREKETKLLPIYFSDKPFEKGQLESTKIHFVPGENIYGRLVLDRPLKNFTDLNNGGPITCLSFWINDSSAYTKYDISNTSYRLVNEVDLSSTIIDFEILVNKSVKKEMSFIQKNFTNYISNFAKRKKKIVFRIRLDPDGGPSPNEIEFNSRFSPKINSYGEFSIDFSSTLKEDIPILLYTNKSPVYDSKPQVIGNNEMPVTEKMLEAFHPGSIFSVEEGIGYRDPKMKTENIKELLLKQYNTNEIVYFKYIKPVTAADYSEERSEIGSGMDKTGNKHFMVIYKDKDDGFYRVMRGTVVKYLEYGSEPLATYIKTRPIYGSNELPNLPLDIVFREAGTDFVYFLGKNQLPQ